MEYLDKLTKPDSGQRLGVQDVIILITDGNTTRSKEGLIGNVTTAKAFGAHIIGVGVGKIDRQEMGRIVSSPFESNYFGVSQFSNLLSVLDMVIQSANCPRSPVVTLPPLPEDCIADLTFLVDDSGSIRDANTGADDNWNTTLRFIKDFVKGLDIGPNRNRIAAVTYSNEAYVQFFLNQYDNQRDIQAAIDKIPYTGGNTNTTGGLKVVRTEVFRNDRGDRPFVKNIVVLITDGRTTREPGYLYEFLYDEACKIKGPGALIFGIGVTNQVDVEELRGIVSAPWFDYYHIVNDFGGLKRKLDQIVQGFCFMASSQNGAGFANQEVFSRGDWIAIENPDGQNPYRCIPTQFRDSVPQSNS